MKHYIFTLVLLLVTAFCQGQNVDIKQLQQMVQNGKLSAQIDLANCYYKGTGISQDYSKAVYWYQKAAEQGNVIAQNRLGSCYATGTGVTQDYSKAVFWWQKAAELELEEAQSNLGDCYYYGKGVPKDYGQAADWYKKSAEADFWGIGELCLADCYAKGLGMPKDMKEAARLYRKAAMKQHPKAYFCLAAIYAKGDGVARDEKTALSYLAKGEELLAENKDAEVVLAENKDAEVVRARGEAYLALNNNAKAKEIWEELQRDYPDDVKYFLADEYEVFAHAMQNGNNSLDFNVPQNPQENRNTFAFIIANENYQRVEKVPFAINDGKVFAEYCKKTLGLPDKNVHIQTDATLGDIKYCVSRMQQIAEAFDGTVQFIFYFAGHGLPAESQQDAYLLPKRLIPTKRRVTDFSPIAC